MYSKMHEPGMKSLRLVCRW